MGGVFLLLPQRSKHPREMVLAPKASTSIFVLYSPIRTVGPPYATQHSHSRGYLSRVHDGVTRARAQWLTQTIPRVNPANRANLFVYIIFVPLRQDRWSSLRYSTFPLIYVYIFTFST